MLFAGGFADVVPVASSISILSVLCFFGLLPAVERNVYIALSSSLSVCEYLTTMLTTHLNQHHINLMGNNKETER